MFSKIANDGEELIYMEDCQSFLKLQVFSQTRKDRIQELQGKLKKNGGVKGESFKQLFNSIVEIEKEKAIKFMG